MVLMRIGELDVAAGFSHFGLITCLERTSGGFRL